MHWNFGQYTKKSAFVAQLLASPLRTQNPLWELQANSLKGCE